MGIWDRFSTMFRSNLNDLISRAEVFDEADLDAALARFDELSPD